MSAAAAVRARVIGQAVAGERSTRLVLFSEDGRLPCLWRGGKQTKAAPQLFDLGEFELAEARGGWPFVRGFRLEHRPAGLGGSYPRLRAASIYARLLDRNGEHFAEPAAIFSESERLFAVAEATNAPDAVLLKGLFRLARAEGYAVREGWLAGIEEPHRSEAERILGTPVAELGAIDAHELVESLQSWLARESDLLL